MTDKNSAPAAAEPKPGEPKEEPKSTVLTDEPKAADPKAQDGGGKAAPEEKVVPEKYDLKPPEGSDFDAADLEGIATYAKERGLSNEEAQALLERDHAIIQSRSERQQKMLVETTSKWSEELKADKEFGGKAFKENAELAKRVVAKYGSQELKDALNSTGLGNHPGLVKMLWQIGKNMAEDKLVVAGESTPRKLTHAERIYGVQQK